MANEVLRHAMYAAQLTELDLATTLAVDPKTVRNWLQGQRPHPQSRTALARLLGVEETVVWPGVRGQESVSGRPIDVVAVYPRRTAVSQEGWLSLFAKAESEIGILAQSAHFLAEDVRLVRLLAKKRDQGVRVRIALSDPDGKYFDRQGAEDEVGESMGTKIRAAILLLWPIVERHGAEVRLHDTVLYNSIYRSDDQLLVNQHAFGLPAAQSPVYHLHHGEGGDMFQSYWDSFEQIWSEAKPVSKAAMTG